MTGSADVRPLKASPSGGLRPALTGLGAWAAVWRPPRQPVLPSPGPLHRPAPWPRRGGASVESGGRPPWRVTVFFEDKRPL